jgi:hypothetical protein
MVKCASSARARTVPGVEIRPARLHDADPRIAEIGDRAAQEVRPGEKVGVEHGDEFRIRLAQAIRQRPGLVPLSVRAAHELHVDALCPVMFDTAAGDGRRVIR